MLIAINKLREAEEKIKQTQNRLIVIKRVEEAKNAKQ